MSHYVTSQVKMLLLDVAGIQTLAGRFHSGFLATAQNPTRQTRRETMLQMTFHLPLLKQPISQVLASLQIFLPFQNTTQNIAVWKKNHTEEVSCYYSSKPVKNYVIPWIVTLIRLWLCLTQWMSPIWVRSWYLFKKTIQDYQNTALWNGWFFTAASL